MHFKIRKRWNRVKRKYFGAERAHRSLLRDAVSEVLDRVDQPVLVETGCIRTLFEGTESTLTIARLVRDRGRFYSFELRPEHIETSREVCGEFDRFVTYVEGDSVANLERLAADKLARIDFLERLAADKLARIDFAFLDSANDGDHTWREFQAIEGCFVPGSILICDDVLWADKGRILVPYIQTSGLGERDQKRRKRHDDRPPSLISGQRRSGAIRCAAGTACTAKNPAAPRMG
jgi:predicted O-methyltransferase YrrM